MAPEIEISLEQHQQIAKWVHEKGEGLVYDKARKAGAFVYKVDDEPLVVYGSVDAPTILCSDKHAEQLERTGIVSFSEIKEPTANS